MFWCTLEAKIKIRGLHDSEGSDLGYNNSLFEECCFLLSISFLCPHSTQPKARSSAIDGSQCWLQVSIIQDAFGTSLSEVWPLDQHCWCQEMPNPRHIQTHSIRIYILVRSIRFYLLIVNPCLSNLSTQRWPTRKVPSLLWLSYYP